jgi:hypothetical protein
MPLPRFVTAFVLGAALVAPNLAAAQQAPRLQLALADQDHDGRISEAERAASLAETTADITPVATLAGALPRVRPVAEEIQPGPLDMARRVVPPSEFEVALEDRFNREVERRRND